MLLFHSGADIKATIEALHLEATGEEIDSFELLPGTDTYNSVLEEVFSQGPNKEGLIDLYQTIVNHPSTIHVLAVDRTSEEALAEGAPPAIYSVLPDGTKVLFFAKDVLVREVIGHELVHVWQDLRGDLGVLNQTTMTWKGQEYPVLVDGSEDYFRLPWEREAYEFQASLLTEEQAAVVRKAALLD